ncbi:MAG: hypothetical protein KDD70_07395 [Bdellovibrionales bacterium]|nr:hypothetical protein [Bdellovibrionales bacterium]
MDRSFVFCAYRPWNIQLFQDVIAQHFPSATLITQKEELTLQKLETLDPEFVFFPDWSWIVPKEIFSRFTCVVFHAAPLPEFRGGSPLQNQILRGITETKLTAFVMDEGIDTGDILLQRDLSLEGHLYQIFDRMTSLTFELIQEIVAGRFERRKQVGDGSTFKRRKPSESELKEGDFENSLSYLYNFMRMLEDPYPNAWIRLGNKRITFKEAEKCGDSTLRVVAEINEI